MEWWKSALLGFHFPLAVATSASRLGGALRGHGSEVGIDNSNGGELEDEQDRDDDIVLVRHAGPNSFGPGAMATSSRGGVFPLAGYGVVDASSGGGFLSLAGSGVATASSRGRMHEDFVLSYCSFVGWIVTSLSGFFILLDECCISWHFPFQ